ncbi:CD276 antigen-like protein [Lates japonicus]|uniref:CD276 antigen-like protein n=1 Tax=Lates japonicus TaxID=270547 RepID=A0AAD3MH69_LATJO|nr:CD276 antigen-like protein [Lates japonicus]
MRRKQVRVSLRVDAPVSKVNMEQHSQQQQESHLEKTTFYQCFRLKQQISCPDLSTSITRFSLTWRFNHSQIILNQSRADISYTVSEEWRQQKEVSDAGETLISNTFLRIKGRQTHVTVIILGVVVAVLLVLLSAALGLYYKYKRRGAEPHMTVSYSQETSVNP